MKKTGMGFISVLSGLFFILGSIPAVYAAQESASEEFTLEEIIVTAEKREVNVQKTAMEITAVTGADIDSKAITDVAKALDGLAAVNVMWGSQGSKVFIRGIGSSLDTNEAAASVSLQKDGVYLGQSEAVASSLFDVERVEVLYGPQGTMYGKNAAGGTVNIITKNPTEKFESSANLTMGEYNLMNWNAMLNVPFSSKWAARVAMEKQKHDAYLSDGSGTSNKLGVRAKLSFKPTDKISFLWTSDYTWDKSIVGNSLPVAGSAGNLNQMMPWAVPDVDNDGVADDFLDADGNTVTGGNGIPDIVDTGWELPYGSDAWTNDEWHPMSKSDYRYQLHNLQIDWDMGWSKLTLIPTMNKNYRIMYSDFITGIATGTGQISGGAAFRETQYTGEARLQSVEDSPFVWTIGGYWYKSNNREANRETTDLFESATDIWENGQSGGPPPAAFKGVGGSLVASQGPPASIAPNTSDNALTALYRTPQDSWAVFGQATYPVTERFRITGGLRKNNDNNNMKYRIIIMNVTSTGKYADLYDSAYDNDGLRTYDTGVKTFSESSSPVTYTAGLEFDVAENSMLYASYKTGYKNGGLNIQGTVPPTPFDPEEVKAYTLGSKNRFMNNRLQLNAEAYYYDYTGYQVFCRIDVYDPFTDSIIGAMNVINADKGTNSGLDISTDFMVTANDRVSASLAYMKTEFGELTIPANGLAGLDAYDVTGSDLPQSPHWSGTLGYEHVFTLDSGATISPRIQTKISTGYWAQHEQKLAGCWQPHYRMSSIYINYTSPDGKYTASLWGKNLENSVVTNYVWPLYRRSISDPRTTGITFSVRF